MKRALLVMALAASAARAQRPNPVNLWLVDLRWAGDRLTVGAPVKLTHDEGNNSQPSFTPDGKSVLFSATRDTGTTGSFSSWMRARFSARPTMPP